MPTYDAEEYELKHYGIKRKSGRYPWGSGDSEAKRGQTFLDMVADLEDQGLSKVDIAKGLGFETTTQLRDNVTIARNSIRLEKQYKAEKLREKGWSTTAIGKEMGLNESSVRALLDPSARERAMILEKTVDVLRDEVDKGGWIEVGKGTEFYVSNGISKEKLRSAVSVLKDEGYEVIEVQIPQAGTNMMTKYKVLCPPGTTYKDVVQSKEKIRGFTEVTDDGGRSWTGYLPALPVSPDRVAVMYKEDGGAAADGVVYVRPGVKDVSIGGSSYAQVRIDVGGTHYIKGMAMYKNDLPPGVDLMVMSNKKRGTPMMGEKNNTVLKPQTEDADNPFGAVIRRQITELGPDGKERVTSAMNILQEEGNWDSWSRTLSSQVLSKQPKSLAEQQLGKTYASRKQDLDEIMSLTNPTVKAHLLEKFAESTDSDAVHLKAAGLPRSSYHVILPFNKLKDTEVYAPNFEHGERVALIRYPHGGTFEIPVLTVNNNHRPAIEAIGKTAKDAVGINSKVAERLSGADFDGDFVMVIPNNDGKIKSTPPLKRLEKFDPQSYKLPDDAPRMTARTKGKEMGDVSNLITDMTIKGAPMDEIARAVAHSMVVIDAEKHHLDYKRSARDHGIAALKERYQRGPKSGADTLISRATSQQRVDHRRLARNNEKEGGPIDPVTGQLRYVPTGKENVRKKVLSDGSVVYTRTPKQIVSTQLAETTDARTLLSKNGGTLIERVYADHSNRLKALANTARKELVTNTKDFETSPTARKVFADEVKKLDADLKIALRNSPRERAAQTLANAIISQKRAENPDMDDATLKRVKSQALKEARFRAGAKKELIEISDRQWEAIQAGAVSKTKLRQILDNTDIERVKELATPRPDYKMSSGDAARARSLASQGLTQAQIANILGVSVTTLKRGLNDG